MMLKIDQFAPAGTTGPERLRRLVLSFAERSKSRLLTTLDDGTEAALQLSRGTVLRGGDRLLAASGEVVEVQAASEALYRATPRLDSTDPRFDLQRAAYHLGNRHVSVELAPGALKLERDPVLRELLLRLGLEVTECIEPFEPEVGAYGGGHRHDHDPVGSSVGEQLSREAHAGRTPDFAQLRFHR